MSKKSLFKSLIPSLVAVSFAGWGSVALAADPIASGDVLGEGICGGNPNELIAGFNMPALTGGGIAKLVSGKLPEAINLTGDEAPFMWENVMPDEMAVLSIELFGVGGDGAQMVVVDQEFSGPPFPENGDLPKTDELDPDLIFQVYFCGHHPKKVDMSDATVELANGKTSFVVDPMSEVREGTVQYEVVCEARSNPIPADGRMYYEANAYEGGINCYIEETYAQGATHPHPAATE